MQIIYLSIHSWNYFPSMMVGAKDHRSLDLDQKDHRNKTDHDLEQKKIDH